MVETAVMKTVPQDHLQIISVRFLCQHELIDDLLLITLAEDFSFMKYCQWNNDSIQNLPH